MRKKSKNLTLDPPRSLNLGSGGGTVSSNVNSVHYDSTGYCRDNKVEIPLGSNYRSVTIEGVLENRDAETSLQFCLLNHVGGSPNVDDKKLQFVDTGVLWATSYTSTYAKNPFSPALVNGPWFSLSWKGLSGEVNNKLNQSWGNYSELKVVLTVMYDDYFVINTSLLHHSHEGYFFNVKHLYRFSALTEFPGVFQIVGDSGVRLGVSGTITTVTR